MTKFDKAFAAEYNAQYAKAVANVAPAEGMDEGILVRCHAEAAYRTAMAVAQCRCAGNGTFAVRNADGGVTRDAQGNERNWHYEVCYGCAGKGFQTPADQKRNWGYWAFYARIEA